MTYEACTPAVWAAVGEDGQNRIHLIVWSLDLQILNEVAQMANPTAKVDGGDGSQELMENAADIDL
jgi:hypothetical protein